MTTTTGSGTPRPTGAEIDDALDAAAQGVAPTSDDAASLPDDEDGEDGGETDVIGDAAGIAASDGKPLGGPDEIARRDADRWELDPRSAEDPSPSDRPPHDKAWKGIPLRAARTSDSTRPTSPGRSRRA